MMRATAAYGVGDQKQAFQNRLQRISAGGQYEHADVVGYRTQKAYEKKHAKRGRRPPRTLRQRLMIVVAFFAGVLAMIAGQFAYFHLSQVANMPEAFVNLGVRGAILLTLVFAGFLIVSLHLSTRGRIQALALGCALMHFGEPTVASHAPGLWTEMFSPAYVDELQANAPQVMQAFTAG